MEAVRRPEDGELCGHVEARAGDWWALTVFGAELGRHGSREDAAHQVLVEGLASLAERWSLRRVDRDDGDDGDDGEDGEDEVVCIIEANATHVTVALGYYSMPGVPTLTIPVTELTAGRWELRR